MGYARAQTDPKLLVAFLASMCSQLIPRHEMNTGEKMLQMQKWNFCVGIFSPRKTSKVQNNSNTLATLACEMRQYGRSHKPTASYSNVMGTLGIPYECGDHTKSVTSSRAYVKRLMTSY